MITRRRRRQAVESILLAAAAFCSALPANGATNIRIRMETGRGTIVLELFGDKAPQTVQNFLRYIDEGRYKEAAFYRTVRMDNQKHNPIKIEVIQGGLGYGPNSNRLPSIKLETTQQTGLKHLDGVISMARKADPDSANSEFFICINDQPQLDNGGMRYMDGLGFAAFGRVIAGMDVVRAIQMAPARGQMLNEPVRIISIAREAELTAEPQ